MHKSQRPQFTDLALVDGRLEPEIELVEGIDERQMRQLREALNAAHGEAVLSASGGVRAAFGTASCRARESVV